MFFREAARPLILGYLALLLGGASALALAQPKSLAQSQPPAPAPAPARDTIGPSESAVRAQLERVARDPDLPNWVEEKTLRFKELRPQQTQKPLSLWPWLSSFVAWLNEASRGLMWLLAATLVALLLVGGRHWWRVRQPSVLAVALARPSHVLDLDIRPTSLPEQVGAAAWQLWQAAQHSAALSLLYRGALSRLVHQFGVALQASSTEGECVELARPRLSPAQTTYFAQLVQVWQLAIYAHRRPRDDQVRRLCEQFDGYLPHRHEAPSL